MHDAPPPSRNTLRNFVIGPKRPVQVDEGEVESGTAISSTQAGYVSRLINEHMAPTQNADGTQTWKYTFKERLCHGQVLSVRHLRGKKFQGTMRVVYEDGSSEIRMYLAEVYKGLHSLELGDVTDRVVLDT